MKFDYAIGNPPYQKSTSNNRQEPIYPHFYDAAEKVAENYMLISPARFLFNAGLTSKDWNNKMLSDEHLKVEFYTDDASSIFSNTEIKGGIAVMYRSANKVFGAIEEFIPDERLRGLVDKIRASKPESFASIMYGGRSDLKFNDKFLKEYPNTIEDRILAIQQKHPDVKELGPNEEYELKSPTFDVLPYVFKSEEPSNKKSYYKILGLSNGKRTYRWIERKFMDARYPEDNNIDYYKAFIPKASGNGIFGEAISSPAIEGPGTSATPSFIGIGKCKTKDEAQNVAKYIRSKFARALLGIRKITQDIVPSKWKYVPLQDFSSSSDIDWSKSVANIDQQLYKKYNLTKDEIDFIENNVKEMD